MDLVDFGTALHRLRRAAGLNQAELAQRLSVSGSMVSRLESGKTPAPADLVLRMGDCMNLAPLQHQWLRELAAFDRLTRAVQAELPHWDGASKASDWLQASRQTIRFPQSVRKESVDMALK